MKTTGITSTRFQGAEREHVWSHEHSLISWKPIFAGLFVAFVIHAALMALGVAIGGARVAEIIQDGRSFNGLATGSAIWIGISALLSLAAGSYFAARTSAYITGRIGAAQGLTIAALFFTAMFFGAGQMTMMAGQGLTRAAGAMGQGAMNLSQNPLVQSTVEDALGNANLKADPEVVVQGLTSRLLAGNTDSAKAYLAAQTGLTSSELDARFVALQNNFDATVKTVATRAADAASKTATGVFLILIVGIGMAIVGGATGAMVNFKRPLTEENTNEHYSTTQAVI